jgi:hypothetical protein
MNRFRLCALGLALLTSSTALVDLKSYDVDPQYRQEIYAALQRILTPAAFNSGAYGQVELLPTGQILVNAPPAALDQVEAVLESIRARPVAAASRVELRYWAVLGSRAAANVAAGVGTAPPRMLDAVLAELEALHGDLSFRVLGAAAVTTESGQPGEVDGMALDVDQRAYVQGDTLNAELSMDLQGAAPAPAPGQGFVTFLGTVVPIGSLAVRTTLRRGEFVVLGESELRGGGLDGPIFFIVHWPEE